MRSPVGNNYFQEWGVGLALLVRAGRPGQLLDASTALAIQSAVGFINTDAIWGIEGNPGPPVPQISDQSNRKQKARVWACTAHSSNATRPQESDCCPLPCTPGCLPGLALHQPLRQEASVACPAQRCLRLLPAYGALITLGVAQLSRPSPHPRAQPTGRSTVASVQRSVPGCSCLTQPLPTLPSPYPGHTRRKRKAPGVALLRPLV